MLYKIIKTTQSFDSRICYFLYKHSLHVENITADTYGICAADISEIKSINDILTDRESALQLLDAAAYKAISVKHLEEFVLDYIDKM